MSREERIAKLTAKITETLAHDPEALLATISELLDRANEETIRELEESFSEEEE